MVGGFHCSKIGAASKGEVSPGGQTVPSPNPGQSKLL